MGTGFNLVCTQQGFHSIVSNLLACLLERETLIHVHIERTLQSLPITPPALHFVLAKQIFSKQVFLQAAHFLATGRTVLASFLLCLVLEPVVDAVEAKGVLTRTDLDWLSVHF